MTKQILKLKNEKEYPKMYYCRHMCQGVVSYEAEEGISVLVKNETIKKMCPTFEGRPVVVMHQKVDMANLKEQMDGVVVNSFYNECDGWFWVKFMALTDACHEAIRSGMKVSNCYGVTAFGEGGTFLNVPYSKEVMDGEFDHMAIIDRPRYEDAIIMTPDAFEAYNAEKELENKKIKNSKDEPKGKFMKLKFWEKKEVQKDLNIETAMVTLENGKDVSIQDMINSLEEAEKLKNQKDPEFDTSGKVKNENSTVTVNGKEMKVSALVTKYETMVEKNNAVDEDEDEKKKKEEEEAAKKKENEASEEEDKKKKEEEEAAKRKENEVKNFEKLQNSIKNGDVVNAPTYETAEVKIKRGQERY